MAAAALEQSMLESKDKDTLLEMAKALGVKANARLKKSDIIDKILDTTGSGSSAASPTPAPHADAPANGAADRAPAGGTHNDRPFVAPPIDAGDAPAAVQLGPDGEPLADWEIELAAKGEATDASDTAADEPALRDDRQSGRTDRTDRNDRTSARRPHPDDRTQSDRTQSDRTQGDRTQGERTPGNRSQDGGQQGTSNQGGNQNSGNQSGGGQNSNRQRNDQGGANQSADGNKRRRRRRKGRSGQEGPQGEDIELVEQDLGFESTEPVDVEGYLDIRDEGYGFLRVQGYLPSKDDAYIPLKLARQYGLRKGDHLTGKVRPAGRNEKNPGLLEVYTVNGADPSLAVEASALREPDRAVPRSATHARGPERSVEHDGAHHRPPLADRQGPARHHRVAAEGRQDHRDEDHRQGHRARTAPRSKCSCCSSTNGPKRSPTCAAASRARSSPRRSTGRARSTRTSPR